MTRSTSRRTIALALFCETVCGRWGVELVNAHSAEADAEATGNLWLKIREKVIACVQSGQVADVLRVQEALAGNQRAGYARWAARQPKPETVDAPKAGAA